MRSVPKCISFSRQRIDSLCKSSYFVIAVDWLALSHDFIIASRVKFLLFLTFFFIRLDCRTRIILIFTTKSYQSEMNGNDDNRNSCSQTTLSQDYQNRQEDSHIRFDSYLKSMSLWAWWSLLFISCTSMTVLSVHERFTWPKPWHTLILTALYFKSSNLSIMQIWS